MTRVILDKNSVSVLNFKKGKEIYEITRFISYEGSSNGTSLSYLTLPYRVF